MNLASMSTRKGPPEVGRPAGPKSRTTRQQGEAFDLWLQRGLHQMFDDVANEPVPEEILRLIQEDRDRATDAGDLPDPGSPQ